MKNHIVKVFPSSAALSPEQQLAWKLAQVASGVGNIEPSVEEMVLCRIIDNASVALASLNRAPVQAARAQALAHVRTHGSTLFGFPSGLRVHAEWAAWANGVAVRELDFHDTFLAADYSHPADSIPPILAVAEQCGRSGADVLRAIVVSYEVHVALVKSICLHKHKIDHIAHLCAAQAAGIGALLSLPLEVIYQAIQQAVHVSFTTRQSRKGAISSWKAFAPAHAGKLAVEAVDRAMRGESSPSPIYEGEDSVIAYMLDGKDAEYRIALPEPGEPYRAILETYTKEHSAEYQAQALIDLAFQMRGRVKNFEDIERITIHTSHHTHFVIGSGAGDPEKYSPDASRETLDHSIMYIFAVALEDGRWHHVESYLPERAKRLSTVKLWKKIETKECPEWTARYHEPDPRKKAFGGRVELRLKSGEVIIDELAVANAHPTGKAPFLRDGYERKFRALTDGIVSAEEQARFLAQVSKLKSMSASEIHTLNVCAKADVVEENKAVQKGIF